jgi:hypothetical protein
MLEPVKYEVIREVIDDFAIVSAWRDGELVSVRFAIPPDGEPTGRLWALLERRLPHPL